MNQNQQRLKDIAEGRRQPKGFSFFLFYKLKITKMEVGKIEAEFTVEQPYLNGIDILHGGALASIADECSGLTTYTLGLRNKVPTLDLSINYLRPALLNDHIKVTGNVIKRGKRVIFVEVEFTSKNKLLAKAYCNHSVIEDGL